jgi:hypothetical protein
MIGQRLRAALFAGATMLLAASTASAQAQTPPNLVGTWKTTGTAVMQGLGTRTGNVAQPPAFVGPMEFTMTISEQNGNRFIGKIGTDKRMETLIGAIAPNNQSGMALDDDGQMQFTIRDADTLDLCYSHLHLVAKLVACGTWKRSK